MTAVTISSIILPIANVRLPLASSARQKNLLRVVLAVSHGLVNWVAEFGGAPSSRSATIDHADDEIACLYPRDRSSASGVRITVRPDVAEGDS